MLIFVKKLFGAVLNVQQGSVGTSIINLGNNTIIQMPKDQTTPIDIKQNITGETVRNSAL